MTLATLFKSLPAKDGKDVGSRQAKDAPRAASGPSVPPRSPVATKARPAASESAQKPRPDDGALGRPAAPSAAGAALKPSAGAPPKREAEPTWEKGAKVGILSGPFAGKVGTIAEMEGTRSARVLLGLLSTRLEVGQLRLLDVCAMKAESTEPGAPRPAAPVARKAP